MRGPPRVADGDSADADNGGQGPPAQGWQQGWSKAGRRWQATDVALQAQRLTANWTARWLRVAAPTCACSEQRHTRGGSLPGSLTPGHI